MEAGSKLIDVFNFSNSTLGHVGFVSGSKRSRRKRRGEGGGGEQAKKSDPFGAKFLTAAWWILKCVIAFSSGRTD